MGELATGLPSYVRETAEGEGTPPGAPAAPRMLTEAEAYAIAADRVTQETAKLGTRVTELESEKSELQTKLDVAEAALATEKAARETAETAHTDFLASQEKAKEVAARTDERTAKVREVASHLADEFFTDERKTRWAEMDDAAFEAYTAELAAASGTVKKEGDGKPPRETAAGGHQIAPPTERKGAENLRAMFEGVKA